MSQLPDWLGTYFWGADVQAMDMDTHARAIISRLLNLGDERAIRWLHGTYTKQQIVDALKTSKELYQKEAVYWAKFYDVPQQEVLCLQSDFRRQQRAIWPN